MGDLFGGMVGAVLAGVAALLALFFAEPLLTPRRTCPECGTKIPRLRGIGNWRNLIMSRRTCLECGCLINHQGKAIRAGEKSTQS
jgi:hypothetical protein